LVDNFSSLNGQGTQWIYFWSSCHNNRIAAQAHLSYQHEWYAFADNTFRRSMLSQTILVVIAGNTLIGYLESFSETASQIHWWTTGNYHPSLLYAGGLKMVSTA